MPKYTDLIRDVYNWIENPDSEVSEDSLQIFLENLGNLIRENFAGKHKKKRGENKLYASNYGLPHRRLWYTVNAKGDRKLKASDQIRFLYGNILEELVLLFAKEAGHEVTSEQQRVNVDGVSGKLDARIDGMLTDVKSASKFGFKKFADGSFLTDDDDPFAYKYQLGLYVNANQDSEGALLVINKETGELVSVILDNKEDIPDVFHKIEQAKIVVERDTPPEEKCYPTELSGKSGNEILGKICGFCDFRDKCWADANDGKGLIEHGYSSGKVFFTKLVRPPNKGKVDDNVNSE